MGAVAEAKRKQEESVTVGPVERTNRCRRHDRCRHDRRRNDHQHVVSEAAAISVAHPRVRSALC